MKRQLKFNYENGKYIIIEDNVCIFQIDKESLKFDSLSFYNGLYKDKNANIELINIVSYDDDNEQISRQSMYIFNWIKDIVDKIAIEIDDPELNEDTVQSDKIIKLYDIAVCAGDGYIIDDAVDCAEICTKYPQADFAVRISGNSMEPQFKDKDVLIIEKVEELEHNNVGIFTIDGDTMCKQYMIVDGNVILHPFNSAYDDIIINDSMQFIIQGKVIDKQ